LEASGHQQNAQHPVDEYITMSRQHQVQREDEQEENERYVNETQQEHRAPNV